MDNSLLFIFGNTPELSRAELHATYPDAGYTQLTPECEQIDTDTCDPNEAIARLGGTVKIARVLGYQDDIALDEIVEHLKATGVESKIVFGCSVYGTTKIDVAQLCSTMKQKLHTQGVSSRFLLPRTGHALSSVVVTGQKVQEYIIVYDGSKFLLGYTAVVQDFQEWERRDAGRPHRSMNIGMLPPKVARMVVNIALKGDMHDKHVLDPFCGVGTVLSEAAFLGAHVYGGDISAEAITYTKANLAWLAETYGHDVDDHEYISDATHISEHISASSIDAIVTEPYLGPTDIGQEKKKKKYTDSKIANIVRGLEKLYIGALKDWKHVLKPAGRVVIGLPEITRKNQLWFVKRVIDTCEKLGYTTEQGPLVYSRPNATVWRKFYILKKK